LIGCNVVEKSSLEVFFSQFYIFMNIFTSFRALYKTRHNSESSESFLFNNVLITILKGGVRKLLSSEVVEFLIFSLANYY
jgi:hypothetical protein